MATGKKAFRRIQASNVEGTFGTAEAATSIVYGVAQIPAHDLVYHEFEQDRNSLAKIVELPIKVAQSLEWEFEGEAYADLLVMLMHMAIRGNVTPSQPDSMNEPNHYLWVFEPSLTGTGNTPEETNGIDSFTFRFGDNIQAYIASGCFVVKIEISGEAGNDEDAIVMVKATLGVQKLVEGSFTGALTELAAAYFPANLCTFFIDSAYADIGDTDRGEILRAWTWTLETMFTGRYVAKGVYTFSALNEDKKAPELELTYIRGSTIVEGELDKATSNPKTITFIRIAGLSNAEMDSGQGNPAYFYLDGAYIYNEWPELDDEDGISVVTVKAIGVQDPTSGKMMTVSIGTTLDAFA